MSPQAGGIWLAEFSIMNDVINSIISLFLSAMYFLTVHWVEGPLHAL